MHCDHHMEGHCTVVVEEDFKIYEGCETKIVLYDKIVFP